MKIFRYRFILRCHLEQEYIFNATFFSILYNDLSHPSE